MTKRICFWFGLILVMTTGCGEFSSLESTSEDLVLPVGIGITQGVIYRDEVFDFSFVVPDGWELRLHTYEPFVTKSHNGIVSDVAPWNRRRIRLCKPETVDFGDCLEVLMEDASLLGEFVSPEEYLAGGHHQVLENGDKVPAVILDPNKTDLPEDYEGNPQEYEFPFSATFFLDYPEIYPFEKMRVTFQGRFFPFRPLEEQAMYSVFQAVVQSFKTHLVNEFPWEKGV